MKMKPFLVCISALIMLISGFCISKAQVQVLPSSLVQNTCIETGNECGFMDLMQVIQNAFLMLRQIAFWVAVGFGIYGGIRLITAQGKPADIKAGQKIILSAFVGLMIVYGASLIINTVLLLLTGQQINLTNIWNPNNFPLR